MQWLYNLLLLNVCDEQSADCDGEISNETSNADTSSRGIEEDDAMGIDRVCVCLCVRVSVCLSVKLLNI